MSASNEGEDESEKLTLQIEDLSIDNTDTVTICANCVKEGSNLNICNKCKSATYCNASCKKKHRHKHKQDCEMRVAELLDIELFKQPLLDDCPICLLPLPSLITGYKFYECCGKLICSGCIHAVTGRNGGLGLCPFCRTPAPSSEEKILDMLMKRVEVSDTEAMYGLGSGYANGEYGLTQDYNKALELWHRAAELGNAMSHYCIGLAHYNGLGMERDEKKANHYYELAAIGGNASARNNLGCSEGRVGNHDRALKHFMLAAGGGNKTSLSAIQGMFKMGMATKEDYTQALRAYQAYLGEIKSPQRDEAAAADEDFKYY